MRRAPVAATQFYNRKAGIADRGRRKGTERTPWPKKSYNYAQLEAVAQEMRTNADMVFYYEYQRPTATLPTGEVLDLVKEFGQPRTSGRGLAD